MFLLFLDIVDFMYQYQFTSTYNSIYVVVALHMYPLSSSI